jgi:hypothetical protein
MEKSMFEQKPESESESNSEEKFQVFMGAVEALIKEYSESISEEEQKQILDEARGYEKEMGMVSDPEEAARRLVMSQMTEGHIVE